RGWHTAAATASGRYATGGACAPDPPSLQLAACRSDATPVGRSCSTTTWGHTRGPTAGDGRGYRNEPARNTPESRCDSSVPRSGYRSSDTADCATTAPPVRVVESSAPDDD